MDMQRKGFTLIELLVVIVIIGIASTIIAVKSSHYYINHKSGERFAKDMAAHIELAKTQAIFTMSMLGIRLESDRYLVVKLIDTDNKLYWQPLYQTDPFWKPQPLPGNMTVEFKSNDTSDKNNKPIPNAPQIMLYPSGELSPFKLRLHTVGSNDAAEIEGNSAGQISVTRKDTSS